MREKSHTHTYQLKHIFIFWHDGELQHALAARHAQGGGRGEDRKSKHTDWVRRKMLHSAKRFQYPELALDTKCETQK